MASSFWRQVTPHSGECDVTLPTGIRNADYFSLMPVIRWTASPLRSWRLWAIGRHAGVGCGDEPEPPFTKLITACRISICFVRTRNLGAIEQDHQWRAWNVTFATVPGRTAVRGTSASRY